MNVLAGILIGWLNETWLARLAVPFAWGIAWCLRRSIFFASDSRAYEERVAGAPLRWGMSPRVAYYFIEYTTAATTSLVFSVLAGVVRVWWT